MPHHLEDDARDRVRCQTASAHRATAALALLVAAAATAGCASRSSRGFARVAAAPTTTTIERVTTAPGTAEPTTAPVVPLFSRVAPNGTAITARLVHGPCSEVLDATLGPSSAQIGGSVGAGPGPTLTVVTVMSYEGGFVLVVHSGSQVARVAWSLGDQMAPVRGWAILAIGPAASGGGAPAPAHLGGTLIAYLADGSVAQSVDLEAKQTYPPAPRCATVP